ncbi:MAG: DUF4446 family protein [Bacillota bacterium]
MWWGQIAMWVQLYFVEITLATATVSAIFLIAAVIFLTKSVSLRKRYNMLMMQQDGLNLEELLNHYGNLISHSQAKNQQFEIRLGEVERQLNSSLAGVGLVRYNAFQETGSDLSFSLALLDRSQNGVVVTSIFGREESRCYGKPVRQGTSSHLLSEEENQALAEAKRSLGLI